LNKLFTSLLIALIIGCESTEKSNQKADGENASIPLVASTNYPLHYFTKRLGGDKIEAIFPLKPGIDPAFNEPYPEEIRQFQGADIIFINGAGYEKWIEKISLSTRKLVNTSSSFEDRYIETEDATHSHGPEGEHSHTELAFTTWLDLGHARAQAKSVLDHLIDYFPENKTEFQAKFVELTDDLMQLESELRLKINSLDNKTAYASHPVYQYLGAGYGLEIISFHWEPGEDPTEEQWEEFTATHHEFQAVIMLWEDKPLPEVIDQLTEMDIRVVVFKPLGNIPENGDFISIMTENIEDLVQ